MRFKIAPTSRIPNSVLLYRPEEYSFDVDPAPDNRFTSVLLDDLNIELDTTGRVVSVWGMCPHTRWKNAKLEPPKAEFGDLFFESDSPLQSGASTRISKGPYLPVYSDPTTRWICIRGKADSYGAVQPIPNVIFEIDDRGQFCALWLKPQQLD